MFIASMLIRRLYQKNLVPASFSLISRMIYYLAGQIFIDNSDFNIMNNEEEDEYTIIKKAQSVLTT